MADATTVASARKLVDLPIGKRRAVAAAAVLLALAPRDNAAAPGGAGGGPVGAGIPGGAAAAATAALTSFQEHAGLPPTGTADDQTVALIVAKAAHQHVVTSRMRTSRVQEMLAASGFAADAAEAQSRTVGDSTIDAVRQFQAANALTVDGLVGDKTIAALRETALTAKLSTKRQTYLLQRAVRRAAKIRGLDATIDEAEMNSRTAGPSTQAAVRALQTSLGLPATGAVDSATFAKINSVAASRRPPVPKVSAPDPSALTVIPRQLRLNTKNKHVPVLQRALAFVGHAPREAELKAATFGASTRKAVIAFQATNGLPQTGAADAATVRALNEQIRAATPGPEHAHRVRGTVRDTSWTGRSGVTVELATDPTIGNPVVVATRTTLANGFYDLPYAVPTDAESGQPVSPLAMRVRFVEPGGATIGVKRILNPTPIAWVNFTEGPFPFRGASLYETQHAAVAAAGAADVTTLVENADRHDVTRVAQLAGLTQDDVMRLVLAARAAPHLGGQLDATVCFAFLAQSLPSNLPDDLLAQTHDWSLIDQLTDLAASGIAATEPDLAAMALDSALAQNLVPIALAARRDTVLADHQSARRRFALDRPLLVGNGTLRATLQRSTVPVAAFDAVADAFVQTGGMGPKFWSLVHESPATYGGAAALASLERGVHVGVVAKNFEPMVQALDTKIGAGAPRLLAKLGPEDWTQLVTDVGSVPPGTDGDGEDAQRATYARTMEAQAQRLFPTVAVTAAVKRSGAGGLTRLDDIEQIVENQMWIDVYIAMSPEFNGQKYWDPVSGGRHEIARGFDATARPWHSSSFVFDGHVVALRLKPLAGQYQLLDGGPPVANSYDYVRTLSDPQGRTLQTLTTTKQISARVAQPDGMRLESGRMVNNTWTGNNGALTVLSNGATVTLLTAAGPKFAAAHTLHRIQPDTAYDRSPFVFSDPARSYFVTSQWVNVTIDSTTTVQRLQYTFAPFSHPYSALFVRELNRSGADGLLNRAIQRFPASYPPGKAFAFASYAPNAGVAVADPTALTDTLDFSRSGAMSVYNWEVFFHIPFLIACKLATNQRFEESLDWFHRIFDPSNTEAVEAPQRYWITKPFFDTTAADAAAQRAEAILATASDPEVSKQIAQWRNHPFVPDVIARFRPVAYQKAVVMRYIDALIDWGDQLFRRETIEAINEATLLYVLAGELLGRRPEHVPMIPREGRSYEELTALDALDPFGNQRVEVQMENLTERPTLVVASDAQALPVVRLAYFAIPANDDLLGYWDRVADRLFKIRNCMDISGRVRQLPLFEPPIDPALLVRATAAGVDLTSVLIDTPAAGSPYRYATLFSSAMSAVQDVRTLGERMLAALQRRDDDALERLRAGNEVALVSLVQGAREAQVVEAQRAREALEQSVDTVQARIDYYASRSYMNDLETAATAVHTAAVFSQMDATVQHTVAAAANLYPSFSVGISGFGGTPNVTVSYGGGNVAASASAYAGLAEGLGAILHSTGGLLETQASYQRRFEDHQLQADLARKELVQVGKQIIAAQVREAVAQHELDAHLRTVDNAKSVEEFFRSKYTGQQLYEWNVAQLSSVYFQAYQLAFDMARRAERAYRFEVCDMATAPIITFGYWDSLKQGLLAGDRLLNDLRRLEATALERNKRRLQATSHISLASLMPDKLLELRTTGTTTIDVAEWMLARENPGWINQRIVSVAVTAPCVVGPYTGVHAGLALTSAVVRINDTTAGGFGDAFVGGDQFRPAPPVVDSIRISHGASDKGRVPGARMDDRYDAFEGAGAISRWTITLDPRDNAFDIATLSDFVLTLEYEGDQGSAELIDLARAAVIDALPRHGALLLWLDGNYAAQWARFLHPSLGDQELSLVVDTQSLQFLYRQLAQHKRLVATGADLYLDSDEDAFDVRITPPGGPTIDVNAPTDVAHGGLEHATTGWAAGTQDLLGQWGIQIKRSGDPTWDALPDDTVRRAWLLLRFETADA